MISTLAPAKINLTLEVLQKRADGFHEIRSVVQTINFADSLRFRPAPRLDYYCDLPEWSASKSLVSRAAELLRGLQRSRPGGSVEIQKRIPLSSGLGGDSSDAAAVLRGLNLLWNLQLSLRDLIDLGAQLGSDVVLFLYGGTLLMEGRGEIVQPLPAMPHGNVVLLFPAIPLSENKTRQMYARLTPAHYSSGAAAENFVKILKNRETSEDYSLYNVFDEVGFRFYSRLKDARAKFLEAGAKNVHLAGSGPTLFTLEMEARRASEIQRRLQEQGLKSEIADY
jgi:4-diphosphocytidyl-2-C-methyl-D-erythritol kinase